MRTQGAVRGVVAGVIAVSVIAGVWMHVFAYKESGFSDVNKQWQSAPLDVYCTGYSEREDRACPIAEGVVSAINRRVGFDLLHWSVEPASAVITITMRSPVQAVEGAQESPGGHYELTQSGLEYTHCAVRTGDMRGLGNLEWLVVYHELGHCVGLAHDDYPLSIMYPTQGATPDRTIPPWISDWDRDLLRERYNAQ